MYTILLFFLDDITAVERSEALSSQYIVEKDNRKVQRSLRM
jgi:hypothetical protein